MKDTSFVLFFSIPDGDNIIIIVGNVRDTSDGFIDTGGIYLLPNGIPRNGTIISVRAFGILGADAPPNAIPYLRVLVFREDDETYNLLYDEEYTHNITSADKLPLNWDVKKGDAIGAFIPYNCIDRESESPKCPSQINQPIPPQNCFYLWYFPVGSDNREEFMTIPADQLKEMQVRLNMEVEIKETIRKLATYVS